MSVSGMKFLTTSKGKLSVLLHGFRYTKKHEKRCGEIVWRCVNRLCSAKLFTSNQDIIKEETHETCVPDIAGLAVLKAKAQAKKRARDEHDLAISQVGKWLKML